MRADHASIARAFGALIPLQPIAWCPEGLRCAPRVARVDVTEFIAGCPLPVEMATVSHAWPDSDAALVAGWYRRSDRHAPAPAGFRELVQVTGEGFGPADHATTAMCLAALDLLPPAPAVDVGCGSGLLAQAWARRWSLPVLAIDLDPAAVAQTNASAASAGCATLIEAHRRPLQTLARAELDGRVVFANLPAHAHRLLVDRIATCPRAVVLSGVRAADASLIVAAYRRLGLRRVHAARRGAFHCHVLVADA